MNEIKFFAIVALVGLILLGVVYAVTPEAERETEADRLPAAQSPAADSPAAINTDLDRVDLGDIDSEFTDIDRDLNSL